MPVDVHDEGAVRTLTLDRPDKLNAFDLRLLADLDAALRDALASDSLSVVILTGKGRAFSSGADLGELAKLGAPDTAAAGDGETAGRVLDAGARSRTFDDLIATLGAFSKPLLMAVNGLGVGFGATILGFADLVFMSTEARLRYPFTIHGTPPEGASSDLLARLVGRQNAAWLLLSSEWISAEDAHRIGLAWKLSPPDELMPTARAHADILATHPSGGLQAVKRAMNAPLSGAIDAAHETEMGLFGELFGG